MLQNITMSCGENSVLLYGSNCICVGDSDSMLLLTNVCTRFSLWKRPCSNSNFITVFRMIWIHGRWLFLVIRPKVTKLQLFIMKLLLKAPPGE